MKPKYAVEVMGDHGDVVTHYLLKSALRQEKTPFQNMELVSSRAYGKMLLLDRRVQTTETDEFVYHEMMTHPALFAHPRPRRVLIIGGGDGGVLRETLKHPSVETAVMVEIDDRVIAFSERYLPTISAGSLRDPRARIVIDDGARFVAQTKEKFDVVVVDSPDPIGPACVLFTKRFYRDIARLLTPKGIVLRQTGSTFLQRDEMRHSHRQATAVFRHVAPYVFAVPTYIGGFFSSLFLSNGLDPAAVSPRTLRRRFDALGLATKYYTPEVHQGAFSVPPYVSEILGEKSRR